MLKKWWYFLTFLILAFLLGLVMLYVMKQIGYPVWIVIVSGFSIIISIVGFAIIQTIMAKFAMLKTEDKGFLVRSVRRFPVGTYKIVKFILINIIIVAVYFLSVKFNLSWNSPFMVAVCAMLGSIVFYIVLSYNPEWLSISHYPSYKHVLNIATTTLPIGFSIYLLTRFISPTSVPTPQFPLAFILGIGSQAVIKSFIGDFEGGIFSRKKDDFCSVSKISGTAKILDSFQNESRGEQIETHEYTK